MNIEVLDGIMKYMEINNFKFVIVFDEYQNIDQCNIICKVNCLYKYIYYCIYLLYGYIFQYMCFI